MPLPKIDPKFYAALQSAEPISNIVGYRRTENRWRHYERLERWPDRLSLLVTPPAASTPFTGKV